MKARLEKDLLDLEDESSQHQVLIQRKLIGVEIGNQCAFISFQFWISCGPFQGCRLNVALKIDVDYPYLPPQVFCHDPGFFHPNKDICTNQILFSLIDPKFWKPTFELKQVLCGIEMILISPEPGYSSLRGNEIYNSALAEGIFQKTLAGGMDVEGQRLLERTQTFKCLIDTLSMNCYSDLNSSGYDLPPRSNIRVKTMM